MQVKNDHRSKFSSLSNWKEVSRNVASVFEISAVNLNVGWCEFAFVMNSSIPGLLLSQPKNVANVSFSNHCLKFLIL